LPGYPTGTRGNPKGNAAATDSVVTEDHVVLRVIENLLILVCVTSEKPLTIC